MAITSGQLGILQHAVGVDKFGRGPMNRNHFCAGAGDEADCRKLVRMGYMRLWSGADPETGRIDSYPYYNCLVTLEGKAAILRESPDPPKLTRSQQRYREYFRSSAGFSFGEWLRKGLYKKNRLNVEEECQ
jgi:hypothetical protein